MAKQIYIDENGNPIEVSGTINNASMLPISANDSTDTKTYIDTLALSDTSKTMSIHTGTTASIYKQSLVKKGNIVYFNASFSTSGTITNGTTIFDYPTGYAPTNTQYGFVGCYNDNKAYPIIIDTGGINLFSSTSMPLSSTFTINVCWAV